MKNKYTKLFSTVKPVKEEELLDYLSKQLPADKIRRVEELLADNEFYADAVEGLEMLDEASRNKLIYDLKIENGHIVSENSAATDWKQFFKVAIAAGVALLIGLFFLFKADDMDTSEKKFSGMNIPSDSSNNIALLEDKKQTLNNEVDDENDNAIPDEAEEEEEDDKITVKAEKNNKAYNKAASKEMHTLAAPEPALNADSAGATHSYKSVNTTTEHADNELLNNALKKFNKGKYEKAVLLFEEELLSHPKNPEANYYCGLAYFKMENYRAANIKFSNTINVAKNSYTEDALWYKAQSLINLGDLPAAKLCLAQIIADKGKRRLEAEKLLSEFH